MRTTIPKNLNEAADDRRPVVDRPAYISVKIFQGWGPRL